MDRIVSGWQLNGVERAFDVVMQRLGGTRSGSEPANPNPGSNESKPVGYRSPCRSFKTVAQPVNRTKSMTKDETSCTGRAMNAENRALNGLREKLRDQLAEFSANWRSPEKWVQRRGGFFGGTVAALIAVPYGMALSIAGLLTINQLLTVVVTDRLPERLPGELNAARGEVKFNRELVAQGVANMACPFFGAPPGVAMLARTVASAKAGAVSRWSVFAHSFILLLFLLPLREIISHIPLVVLAAVTVAVGLQLVGIDRFRNLNRMNRADAALFLLTFALVVFSDLIVGVGIGSLIAMLLFVERAAQSTQLEQIESLVPGPAKQEPSAIFLFPRSATLQSEMQMYRLTGPLFFASSEKVLTRLLREVTAKTLVLDLTEAGPIDSAATDCLRQLAARQRQRNGELHLIGLDARLFDSIERDGLLSEIGLAIRRDEPQTIHRTPEHASGKLSDNSVLVHPPVYSVPATHSRVA